MWVRDLLGAHRNQLINLRLGRTDTPQRRPFFIRKGVERNGEEDGLLELTAVLLTIHKQLFSRSRKLE